MKRALAENVLSVLRSTEPQRTATHLRRFTERDWERSLFWLDASGLALHFWHALRGISAEDVLPQAVALRLQSNYTDNARRTKVLCREFKKVNNALEDARIPFAALKGFTLVPEFCADSALRLQLDLDYLVAREQEDAAAEVLRRLGYVYVSRAPWEVQFATNPGILRNHADLYKPPVSTTLELHFRLFDPPEIRLALPDDVLQRCDVKVCAGMPVNVLHAEDQFLDQVLHVFHHLIGFNLRLSSLLEIARAVETRRDEQRFWAGLRGRVTACDPRTAAIFGLVLALTREMFCCEIPAALSAWTIEQCPPAVLLWVRTYGRKWALQPWPGSKLSFLVASELVDRRWAYARASILPLSRPGWVVKTGGAKHSKDRNVSRAQRRFVATRARFHLREAVRLVLAWPTWMWRRRFSNHGPLFRATIH